MTSTPTTTQPWTLNIEMTHDHTGQTVTVHLTEGTPQHCATWATTNLAQWIADNVSHWSSWTVRTYRVRRDTVDHGPTYDQDWLDEHTTTTAAV